MDTFTLKSKKVNKLTNTRKTELTIINGLDFAIDCQIETLGDRMTIWITKKEMEK